MRKITRIVVLGAGNSGCFTALSLSWHSRHQDNFEIRLIHDPKIRPEKVGQATFPPQLLLLWRMFPNDFNFYLNPIHATTKTGILYENWGKVNRKVFHPFPAKEVAIHFCPSQLQDYILRSGVFEVEENTIDNLDDIDADYIIDCRGKPDNFDHYDTLTSPVNSAILAKPRWDVSRNLWTQAIATPDGWTFVIPNQETSPSFQGSIGYLYNSKITSRGDAEKNLSKLFDANISTHLSFNNYLAKEPIPDERTFLSGNRLFFIEPLEATAVHTHMHWADTIFDVINGNTHPLFASHYIRNVITEIQDFLLWHYQFGSIYQTPFWDHAKTLEYSEPEKFNQFLTTVDTLDMNEMISREAVGQLPSYGVHAASSAKYWMDGMTISSKD